VQWQLQVPEFDLVVLNLAPYRSQCCTKLTVPHLAEHDWSMKDLAGPEQYLRPGAELESKGLYLDLPARGAQLFRFRPT
jgi:hypothetical protein